MKEEKFNIFVWLESTWHWCASLPWGDMLLWYTLWCLLIILFIVKVANSGIKNTQIELKDSDDFKGAAIWVLIPIIGSIGVGFVIWDTWGQHIINKDIKDIRLILKNINEEVDPEETSDIKVSNILRKENTDLHKIMISRDKENRELKKEVETLKDMTGGVARTRGIKSLVTVATKRS